MVGAIGVGQRGGDGGWNFSKDIHAGPFRIEHVVSCPRVWHGGLCMSRPGEPWGRGVSGHAPTPPLGGGGPSCLHVRSWAARTEGDCPCPEGHRLAAETDVSTIYHGEYRMIVPLPTAPRGPALTLRKSSLCPTHL